MVKLLSRRFLSKRQLKRNFISKLFVLLINGRACKGNGGKINVKYGEFFFVVFK